MNRQQFRRGTAAAWTAANPVLAQGEPGLETDTAKLKIGDGATAWVSLAYFAVGVGGPPSGAATGDLSGSYPAPTVAKLNGISVSGTPAIGQAPIATSTTAAIWQPVPAGAQGIQGIQGVIGLTGPQGPQGIAGSGGAGGSADIWSRDYRLRQMVTTKWATPAPPDNTAGVAEATIATIQAAYNATPGGSTYVVPDGIYRGTLTLKATTSITAANPGKASIRGSDVWATWTFNGGLGGYVSTLTVPVFGTDGAPVRDAFSFANRDQVFIDGVMQTHVLAAATLAAGQYKMVNYATDRRIVLYANPAGHTVEVTTREAWIASINGLAGPINVSGIEFRHAATATNSRYGFDIGDCPGTTITRNVFRDSYGTAMGMGSATPANTQKQIISENWFYNHGCSGIQGYASAGARFARNWFILCGQAWNGVDETNMSSGIKLYATRDCLMDENFVGNGLFAGLWIDTCSANAASVAGSGYHAFKKNVLWDIQYIADHNETSAFTLIEDEIIVRTPLWTWAGGFKIGIYNSTSRQTIVRRCLVIHYSMAINNFWSVPRGTDQPPGGCNGIQAYDNTVLGRYHAADNAGSASDKAMKWSGLPDGTLINDASNVGGGNWYGYPGVEDGATHMIGYQYPDGRWEDNIAGTYTTFTGAGSWSASRWENAANLPAGTTSRVARELPEQERHAILISLGLN